MSKLEYVYLLRVFPGNDKWIFKYGRTMRHFPERFKDYHAAKPTIILVLSCTYCKVLESATLADIRKNFMMRNDLGREYFEGDLDQVKRLIINKYRTHVKEYKFSATAEEQIDINDSQSSFEAIINDHSYNLMTPELALQINESAVDLGDLLEVANQANNKRFIRYLHENRFDIFGVNYENYFKLPLDIRQFYSTMAPDEIVLQDPIIIARALKDEYLANIVSQESIKIYLIDCINRIDYAGYKKFAGLYRGDHSELVELMEICDIEYFTNHQDIEYETDREIVRRGFFRDIITRLTRGFNRNGYKKH